MILIFRFFNILTFIFFFTQFNNNNNKICQTHGFNPTHVGWVGLGWTYVMGWIGLNFFESKNPLNPTQPNPCTPLVAWSISPKHFSQPRFDQDMTIWSRQICVHIKDDWIPLKITTHSHRPKVGLKSNSILQN